MDSQSAALLRCLNPFSWKIIFTSSDKNISRKAMLLKTASLTLQPSPQSLAGLLRKAEPLRVVQGVVTGLDMLGVSADEARAGDAVR